MFLLSKKLQIFFLASIRSFKIINELKSNGFKKLLFLSLLGEFVDNNCVFFMVSFLGLISLISFNVYTLLFLLEKKINIC